MPKRRLKGEGSITEYRKGRYRGFIDLGIDPKTHKRIRKTFTGTKKEVIEALNKARYDKQSGILTINSQTPFNLFFQHWLTIKQKAVKGSTYETWERTGRNILVPYFTNTSLCDIDVSMVNKFLLEVLSDHKSSSVGTYKSVLSNCLSMAVKEGLIPNNPVKQSEPVKTRRPEIRPLSQEEISTLLKAAKNHSKTLYLIIKVSLELGARRSEVLGLNWSDIDFKRDTITIRRIVSYTNNEIITTTPKTQTSIRTESVSHELIEELQCYQKETQTSEIVFKATNGKYMQPNTYYFMFKELLRKSGLRQDIRPHDLRHTNATILIAKGVNPKTVSQRLGHSTVNITLNLYTHAVKEEDERAANIMSNLMKT